MKNQNNIQKNEKQTAKADVYKIITDRIVELLEKGTIPWKQSWKSILPQNLVSKNSYRGFNKMFLSCFGYSDPRFLTIQQCNTLGGRIKKGERGIPVIYYQKSIKLDSGALLAWDKATAEQRKAAGTVNLLKYYVVFNVAQCTGLELPELPFPPASTETPLSACEAIVDAYINGPTVEESPTNEPCYYPGTDLVLMPNPGQFDSLNDFYLTLFHEFIHSTGHRTRLAREEVVTRNFFGSQEYSREELVAELGACFLANHSGILDEKRTEQSAAYMQGWIRVLENDPKMILQASGAAQKAAEFILHTMDVSLAA